SVLVVGCCASLFAAEPCQSGIPAGQRPGPYSFLVCTGAKRGQPSCFICETEDRPAVIVFARTMTDSLGELVHQLAPAVLEKDKKEADLRAWVTFLSDDHTKLDAKVVKWSEKHAIKNVPLGVFEDVVGPPTYKLAKDADVTVLLFVKQKVVANFA